MSSEHKSSPFLDEITRKCTFSSVKARTDQDKLGSKLVDNRHDDLVEGVDILRIAHAACWPGNVDVSKSRPSLVSTLKKMTEITCTKLFNHDPSILSTSWAFSYCGVCRCDWISRVECTVFITVNRTVNNIGIIDERLLSAIAVMNIPICRQIAK